MTTSTKKEQTEIVEEPTEKPYRDINEIIDLPYSELTDEEIERVIQFRADNQTRDNLHNEAMKQISDAIDAAAAEHMRIANEAQQMLNDLTAHAIERFKDASDEQA